MSGFDLSLVSAALEPSAPAPAAAPGLDFSGRSMKLDNAADAEMIVSAMGRCPELRSLDLTGNTLGVGAAAAIADALRRHPEFHTAKWSDMFTGRMKTEIPPALSALGNGMIAAGARLAVLELSDNAFGPVGVNGLAELLRSDVCSQLQELRLNNNGLGITGGRLLAGALLGAGAAGSSPPRLKVFIAGRNRLENDGAKALAEVFKKMGSLVEIAMPQNGIYHAGVTALCEAFAANPGLRSLNLNDNTVGCKGAAAFARVLPGLAALRDLNLGDCLLKSAGAQALAKGFRDNDVLLERLDLSHNEISKAACTELVQAVTRLPGSLDRLDRVVLAGNRLGGAANKKALRERLGASAALSDGEDSDDDGAGDEEDSESEVEAESEEAEAESAPESGDSGTEDGPPATGDADETLASARSITLDTSGVEEVLSDVSRFLREPTLEHLERLGAAPADLIDVHLQAIPDAVQAVEAYVEAAMLVSGLAPTSAVAERAARDLYAHTVRRAGEKHAAQWALANAMLVHLGLIKSESKSFQIRWELDGCYWLLSRVIHEPFFPESLRETIRFFGNTKREKAGGAGPGALWARYPDLG